MSSQADCGFVQLTPKAKHHLLVTQPWQSAHFTGEYFLVKALQTAEPKPVMCELLKEFWMWKNRR